jgi:chromate transporter
LRELARYFLWLGTTGFGGPVALCALMERDLVERRGWLAKTEMRDIIAVCQTLPGPLAVQVGIFIGYRRGGFRGALIGGWSLILPASIMVGILAAAYVHFHGLPWLTAIIYGVNPAVVALILQSW